jgi:hypothetical protein
MNDTRFPVVGCLIACSMCVGGLQPAAAETADPVRTTRALNLLLAESSSLIPATSTCQGNFGQRGSATVGNLLAMQLAYLYSGDNTILGACSPKRCDITITHSAGEDVSSTSVSFRLRGGRADVRSMQCVMTP